MTYLVGEFTLDPKTKEFQNLRSVCEPGNPWRCLIGTAGSIHLGKRMSVRLNHEQHSGIIGVTVGDYRFERPMTPAEVRFATNFDLGRELRKPLTVRIDLEDGTWIAKPKRGTPGARPAGPRSKIRGGQGKPQTRSIRARQLRAIREAAARSAS